MVCVVIVLASAKIKKSLVYTGRVERGDTGREEFASKEWTVKKDHKKWVIKRLP